MTEAAADEGRWAQLPEQPGKCRGAGRPIRWQEGAELFGEIYQDRAGFEDADRRRPAAVHERRDLGVGVDLDEAGAELVAFGDIDPPGIIFGAAVAKRQPLLQPDRNLLAVRRGERFELQRALAHGELFARKSVV